MIFRRRKPPLTLHIGLGKTGTTVLQQFFWSNRKVLADHGIDYPKFGVEAGAHHLLSPYADPALQAAWDFVPATTWAPKLAKNRNRQTLLSSELMVAADAETTRDFCRVIKAHFNARVVIYLRRQDNILIASYNQNVKTGRQFRRLCDVYTNMLHRFDYAAIVSRWADQLGTENIIVRPYEQGQFYAQDIRRDFIFHAFGIDDADAFSFEEGDPNPRLDPAAVEYKRMLNCVVEDTERLQRFQELLSSYSRDHVDAAADSGVLLTSATRKEVLALCEEGNAQIARNYLHRPDGKLFLEPPPDPGAMDEQFSLSPASSNAITDYLVGNDARLMEWLANELPQYLDSERPVIRTAAKRLTAIITPR